MKRGRRKSKAFSEHICLAHAEEEQLFHCINHSHHDLKGEVGESSRLTNKVPQTQYPESSTWDWH